VARQFYRLERDGEAVPWPRADVERAEGVLPLSLLSVPHPNTAAVIGEK